MTPSKRGVQLARVILGGGIIVLFLWLLVGCETIPSPPQVINVPVAVSCLPSTLPQRPAVHSDSELSELDEYKLTLALFLDRRKILNYAGELEAVIGGCK